MENLLYVLDVVKEWFVYAQKNYRKQALLFLVMIGVLIAASYSIFPSAREKIRAKEMEVLVNNDFLYPNKVKTIHYHELDKLLKEKPAVTVIFAIPNGKEYTNLLKLMNKEKEVSAMNRMIYFYPIIYDLDELSQKYQLNVKKGMIDIIFFSGGTEKNRIQLSSETVMNNQVIQRINTLAVTEK
ncbi:hypothetical protein [Pilibacter termitis]|nr:hypothetical protein [Pilibacter termitis]